MTVANRKNKKGKIIRNRKKSALLSILQFLLDVLTIPFTHDIVSSIGGLAVLMFIIGFLLALFNFLALIHVVTITTVGSTTNIKWGWH
ncbi:hypothetical protein [Alicyclobacillus fastidiosus]|uniref:Uncharacterized protein n=1 Tax=Alicyclobacillus fastidiosus TaxID=392011 RepID=A0ABV5ALA1_9BACL|nr:hypothetical protein [Alicyclobacillus fastidiosus]WEH08492.1 hypothetical protein PYS47_17620 [Alicyclobacillus fastidiosus]